MSEELADLRRRVAVLEKAVGKLESWTESTFPEIYRNRGTRLDHLEEKADVGIEDRAKMWTAIGVARTKQTTLNTFAIAVSDISNLPGV